ncbi:MAG TPA: methyl-accepting chemotaxis protein [Usitatibacter sp.]|nr:methyl-accepting chemotaxis protein [Usitatibacter sp.]
MNWLARSIRNKILAVFVLGLALVVAGALFGFAAARSGLATVAQVNDTLIAQAIAAQGLEGTFKEQMAQWANVLLRGQDPKALDKSWKQFTFREREVRRAGEKLLEVVELPNARDLLQKFLAAHATIGTKYREALETFKDSNFDAKKIDSQVKGLELEAADGLEDLVKIMRDEADKAVAGARAKASRALALSLAVIAISTLVALIGCAILITRTVARPLERAVSVVDRVAAGDLTVRVDSSSRDETGRLLTGLGKMRDALGEAVAVIRRSAETVGAASKQIAAGHADLSSRTEEQAASLEETASSMQELAATVKQNAENAREANQLAAETHGTASKGGKVMADVVGTMGGISDASRKISEIVGVIDSIAFQTNILALNAAVEAARAGEQGRGFAVVAAEVRALAQRSAGAAKEIKDLIKNSTDRVGEGKRLVETAGTTMQEFVVSVQRVTEMMKGISDASQEQLSGIEQVSGAVTQMDRVVQQNAALVSQAAAATENMADQAQELMESVARFRLEGDAGDAAPEARPVGAPPEARIEPTIPRAMPRIENTDMLGRPRLTS